VPPRGKLKWEGGRLILEVEAVVRIPIQIVPVATHVMSGVNLTRREQETLELLVQGKTNKEIAAMLHIGVRTVKYFVGELLRKFSVSTRLELGWLFGKDGYRAGAENPPQAT
jgi:DNA-binding NarL/FixJ family response regulator